MCKWHSSDIRWLTTMSTGTRTSSNVPSNVPSPSAGVQFELHMWIWAHQRGGDNLPGEAPCVIALP